MTRSDAWSVGQTVFNEIMARLAQAGHEEAMKDMSTKEVRADIRALCYDLSDY